MSSVLPPASSLIPAQHLRVRPAAARGINDHGWLKAAHSFSFGSYRDPENTHFHALRVINDDRIAPGGGFPMHPHADFEIFSYVLDGAIEHRDSLGNGSTVGPGGIQFMSAGTGVRHSEFNPSSTEALRLLQIWMIPEVKGAPPRYEIKTLTPAEKDGALALFISQDGRGDTIETLAPGEVYAGTFRHGQTAHFTIKDSRAGFVQMARGSVRVNGLALTEGDGLEVNAAGELSIHDGENAEIVLFDLAAR